MIRGWIHPMRDDHVILGGKWMRAANGSWTVVWVANNKTANFTNFNPGQGDTPGTGGDYVYMMPSSANGRWGDYTSGREAFVCESGK